MIFYLILAGIALMMAWYALVTFFLIVVWLTIQPIRLALWLAVVPKGATKIMLTSQPPLPSNVIRFPGPSLRLK
jgi:hypothetical protein